MSFHWASDYTTTWISSANGVSRSRSAVPYAISLIIKLLLRPQHSEGKHRIIRQSVKVTAADLAIFRTCDEQTLSSPVYRPRSRPGPSLPDCTPIGSPIADRRSPRPVCTVCFGAGFPGGGNTAAIEDKRAMTNSPSAFQPSIRWAANFTVSFLRNGGKAGTATESASILLLVCVVFVFLLVLDAVNNGQSPHFQIRAQFLFKVPVPQ